MKKKIAVGLSGGIDSSVAAYLLKSQGWDVIGFTIKFQPQDNRCCDLDSLYQAQRLCHKLEIPHYTLDAEELFKKEIIDYFIESYLKGLTPNPCVYCNRLVKFGFFLDKVKGLNVDYLATGHYARLVKVGGEYTLKAGKDDAKSQEYFLSMLRVQSLKQLVFPLGEYIKEDVKKIAKKENIIFKERKESQDVCFVQDKGYFNFINENIDNQSDYAGNIRHINGKILGRHDGFYKYTYGQRGGLGISWSKPLYVIGIDHKTKDVIVGEKEYLYRDNFYVHSLNWFISPQKDEISNIKVKVRYRSKSHDCLLRLNENKAEVILNRKINSIAPGQIAAFYNDNVLLGAGVIV